MANKGHDTGSLQAYLGHKNIQHTVRAIGGSVQGVLAMKFRLSDAASFEFLVEHYRTQAEACHQMARMTLNPYKEVWLELAEEWTKLVRETEVKGRKSGTVS